jgi:hypothetical protein
MLILPFKLIIYVLQGDDACSVVSGGILQDAFHDPHRSKRMLTGVGREKRPARDIVPW